jgi:acetoin utilization deacetylase AcuC-like enzyme
MLKAFYHDQFVLPLPEGHRFPMSKYALLRQAVAEQLAGTVELCAGPAATDEDLLRAHTPDYLQRVKDGTLSIQEQRRIGFPWSPQMVERSRRSVGSSIAAAGYALEEGAAVNLAGGTHHAGPDWGQGYCVFNDAAVAARAMQAEGRARRVIIIDCDVHQGNGTAAIFQGDSTVYTFSIHGARNFPAHKSPGDLDVGLEDGVGDEAYLEVLAPALQHALAHARPDLALYLSGADPYMDDTLGRLSLSMAGLRRRDELVLEACREAGLPVAVAMAGGYARDVRDTVAIHLQTVRAAAGLVVT